MRVTIRPTLYKTERASRHSKASIIFASLLILLLLIVVALLTSLLFVPIG